MKNTIKKFLLFTGSIIYMNRGSKIFYYHDIHKEDRFTDMSTPISLFQKHIELMKSKGYTIVKEIKHPNNEIEITFDDGFNGLYENFDFFLSHKIPVTLFPITERLGKPKYLDPSNIRKLLLTGLLRLGSHTCTHRNLDLLKDKEVKQELDRSKKTLEDLFGCEISTLCFPRGRFDDRVLRYGDEVGYKQYYSSLPGSYGEQRNNILPRSFVQNASLKEFRWILKGGDKIFYSRYLKMHYRRGKSS
jgi:peptidoglycan/xylan/chitin deacetylase (PgdA/CDA1 family)